MKHIMKLALMGVVGFAVMGADNAMAKTKKSKTPAQAVKEEVAEAVPAIPHAGEKPLMVVRFNQTAVPYEWPLYNTLTKALEVRPLAQFDVVSVAPRANDLAKQLSNNEAASTDTAKVLATLKEIGMPDNRYTVSKIYDDVPSSEVRVYVR